jgi:hypothetical protein
MMPRPFVGRVTPHAHVHFRGPLGLACHPRHQYMGAEVEITRMSTGQQPNVTCPQCISQMRREDPPPWALPWVLGPRGLCPHPAALEFSRHILAGWGG